MPKSPHTNEYLLRKASTGSQDALQVLADAYTYNPFDRLVVPFLKDPPAREPDDESSSETVLSAFLCLYVLCNAGYAAKGTANATQQFITAIGDDWTPVFVWCQYTSHYASRFLSAQTADLVTVGVGQLLFVFAANTSSIMMLPDYATPIELAFDLWDTMHNDGHLADVSDDAPSTEFDWCSAAGIWSIKGTTVCMSRTSITGLQARGVPWLEARLSDGDCKADDLKPEGECAARCNSPSLGDENGREGLGGRRLQAGTLIVGPHELAPTPPALRIGLGVASTLRHRENSDLDPGAQHGDKQGQFWNRTGVAVLIYLAKQFIPAKGGWENGGTLRKLPGLSCLLCTCTRPLRPVGHSGLGYERTRPPPGRLRGVGFRSRTITVTQQGEEYDEDATIYTNAQNQPTKGNFVPAGSNGKKWVTRWGGNTATGPPRTGLQLTSGTKKEGGVMIIETKDEEINDKIAFTFKRSPSRVLPRWSRPWGRISAPAPGLARPRKTQVVWYEDDV
ncbi:hypothetical protein FA13DRAFT_1714407 [Coprinellus micaceus]|uniref:Uncharacterized protein n=1 Tax=Coprinellus micaceus TaxID=71717 RepID=A0A4Y7SSA6_COPMI|nr:hypothetical protein FA13DRAFT_1714407 [Coprinellus micaceus]